VQISEGAEKKRRYKRMDKTMMDVILAALICITVVAPAMAQPAPFVIDGYVSSSNGDPCNDPAVQIKNVNTDTSWDAENSSTSNYYRLVLESDDVSEGNVLEIEASGCSQLKLNTTEHTVSQAEIDGGGFSENVTLEPEIVSCDSAGAEKDQFAPNETVYAKLCAANCTCGDGAQKTVTTDADGSFAVTALWDVPEGATATYDEYDIVADRHGTGEGTYNAASDGIDSTSVAGIVAPVPELTSIILFAVGLVMLLGCMRFGRRD
jgi:hypothetical protein